MRFFNTYSAAILLFVIAISHEVSYGQRNFEKDDFLDKLRHEVYGYLKKFNVSKSEYGELLELFENIYGVSQRLHEEKDLEKSVGEFQKNNVKHIKRLPLDPDAQRNATELIKSKGFDYEEHDVTTADGYILLVLRIKPRNKSPSPSWPPVFLLHGLLSSSDCYINNYRNESLGFILADLGYDVWLGNIRGNRYSMRHQTLHPNTEAFWKWSFDEMGQYDVPVMVDFVLSKTGHKKLNFIGHSEGTTNLITSVIVNGKPMAEKINKFIALAPAVYVGHTKSILRYLVKVARIVQFTYNILDEGDFFAHNGILGEFGQKCCYYLPNLCWDVMGAMVGPGRSHYNQSRIPVYLSHAPAGTSTQNMVHWAQQIEAGEDFVYYDYGSRWRNYLHYHQTHPPKYNLSEFNVPTYALLGSSDWMITPEDSVNLVHKLPNVKWYKMYPNYTHIDFVWGYNIVNTAFQDIINILML